MSWKSRDIGILERAFPREKYIRRYSDSERISLRLTSSLKNEDLIIAYWKRHNVYIAWDAVLHKKLFTGSTHTLSVGQNCCNFIQKCESSAEGMKRLENTICSFSKRLTDGQQENIVLVGSYSLKEFCDHYSEYDFFTLEGESDNGSDVERESIVASRKKRDPTFRQRVLGKYDYTCIVCGCREPILLQAAHIKSVAEGGSDDTSNGYCLCANHHGMFDAGLLKIDMKTQTFACNPTSEMNSAWYKEAEQRAFQLWLPNNQN